MKKGPKLWPCPRCGGRMDDIEGVITPQHPLLLLNARIRCRRCKTVIRRWQHPQTDPNLRIPQRRYDGPYFIGPGAWQRWNLSTGEVTGGIMPPQTCYSGPEAIQEKVRAAFAKMELQPPLSALTDTVPA